MRGVLPLLALCSIVSVQQITLQAESIQDSLAKLNQYEAIQKTLGIQNPDLAYGFRKALVIADLLIDANGTLLIGSIPSVRSSFISAQPAEYEVNMNHVLNQLDSSWQPFFDSITASEDPNQVGNLVVRGLLSLDHATPVTNRHAKVAVLSAMLAPYNQGPVGDCFAVADVIRDHTEYYRNAAMDYQSIVMQGSLERLVNGNTDYFFFLPVLADTDRDQPFDLTPCGMIGTTSYSLFDAPGFAAACLLMGGNSIADLEQDVVNALAGHSQVTPSQVIQAKANAIALATGASADTLLSLGEYAFSSLTNHGVLRGVEAAFAAMAEDRAQDSTRGNINDAVARSLAGVWNRLSGVAGVNNFKSLFTTAFNNSYRLVYNLDIPLAQPSADGSSTSGGFQLYERTAGMLNVMGTRVATPQAFQKLVLDAINTAASQFVQTSSATQIVQALESTVQTDSFLKNVLWNYDPSNRQEPNPIQNYQNLARTPMQSCDGDNPYEVADIDTGTTYDNDVQSYTPSNMQDLLTWCLDLTKTAPKELLPMTSPQHAFNFVPANPDFSTYTGNAQNWIRSTLIVPGMSVSTKKVRSQTHNAVVQEMASALSNVMHNQSAYQKLVQTLSISTLTVQGYAQKFLKGLYKILPLNEDQKNELALIFDSVLIQNLPSNDQALLNRSAVRFAFTNWNEGLEDIYFCAYFNPRTQLIGFGTILENKTGLSPMDETAWVNHQQWSVDLKAYAPIQEVVNK